jgi:hypothetical protein
LQNLILAQVFTAFFLTGLIWTIQLVHYPSFLWIDQSHFKQFEAFHSFRISLIVMPIMILELVTAFFLTSLFYKVPNTFWFNLNFLLVLLIWASTFLLSVPCHSVLNNGYSESIINKLVFTNWVRTILWSLRSIGWFYFLMLSFSFSKVPS